MFLLPSSFIVYPHPSHTLLDVAGEELLDAELLDAELLGFELLDVELLGAELLDAELLLSFLGRSLLVLWSFFGSPPMFFTLVVDSLYAGC